MNLFWVIYFLILLPPTLFAQGTGGRRAFWGKGQFTPVEKTTRENAAKNKRAPAIDLQVEVFDAELKPVQGANVKVQKQIVQTDANGYALLLDAIYERTVIKISKPGYFDGYTATYKPTNGRAVVRVQLTHLPPPFSFQDTNSITIVSPTGLKLTFPKKGIVLKETGAPYSGIVYVYLQHRAPENDPLFAFAMPGGDFTALDVDNQTVALNSYGFFNAELRGTNDEILDLAPHKPATVEFRIPEAMRTNAQATVPLWAFHEIRGIWKYDSRLIRAGDCYKGKVSHFSSWNCDYKGATCTVIASTQDCAGKPVANVSICLNQTCAVTDSMGKVRFINAPADIPIRLYSQEDTLNIGIIGAGKTYTLPQPFLASERMLARAQYWKDSVAIDIYGGDEPVLYALDGKNWQTQALFTGVPLQDSINVWIKDASQCPILRTAYHLNTPKNYPCLAAENESQIKKFSTSLHELNTWNGPLYWLKLQNDGDSELHPEFSDALLRYPCLARLTLYGGNAKYLPNAVFELPVLTRLSLLDNSYPSLPPEIGKLTTLKELSLINNNYLSLPPEIGKLTALTKLSLACNQLSTLPPEIGKLSTLQSLDLSSNQFRSIPPEIFKLSELTKLNLYNNQLPNLPSEVKKWINLNHLDLRYNKLTTLPPEIGKCLALKTLDLRENPITAFPPEIANLANTLEEILLDKSAIPAIEIEKCQKWLPKTRIFFNNTNEMGEYDTDDTSGCYDLD